MYLLNRFFAPFAAILVLSAFLCARPERPVVLKSVAALATLIALNAIVAFYGYRWIAWTKRLQQSRIWGNFILSIALIYLLGLWWGPMWLLLMFPAVTSALQLGAKGTLTISSSVGASLLAIYALRGMSGPVAWGQALNHAVFIVLFSFFVNRLSRIFLRLRDGS